MKLLNQDPDEHYQGAMFSPKTTLYAGIFLLALVLLAVGRHYYLGVPFGYDGETDIRSLDSTEVMVSPTSKDSL